MLAEPQGAEDTAPTAGRPAAAGLTPRITSYNVCYTKLLRALDDEAVVHNFVPHVDRWAEFLDRALDDLDGALDPGAEPARAGQNEGRITSYNVCYTKLLRVTPDFLFANDGQELWIGITEDQ